MGMVEFGLSNVYFAPYNTEGTKYDTPIALKGAVKLTTDPQGESSVFYADNVAYETFESNSGYKGTLNVAVANDDFLKAALGYEVDSTSKLTIECTDSQPTAGALLFEVSGNEKQQRTVFYNVTFSRLSQEHNTKAESITPDTVTLDFTAIGRDFTVGSATRNVVKGTIDNTSANKTVFDGFMTKVVVPGAAA